MSTQDETKPTGPLLFPEPADRVEIPDKLYFRIGEVCRITGVAAHVLRFWESEFPQIRPGRTDAGQRLYNRSDIERILSIKNLLYNQKFTIKGARRYLGAGTKADHAPRLFQEIVDQLAAIRDILS